MNKYIISILVILLLLSSSSPVVSYHMQEGNDSPSAPIIEGPNVGKVGVEYEYTFLSIDPNGDNLSYFIDWGDGNEIIIGPYESGEQASATHKWDEPGRYTIRAQAIDEFGEDSTWSYRGMLIPNYFLEDVNVLISGRCRDVGAIGTVWIGLIIGNLTHAYVVISETFLQRAHVVVYDESILNPLLIIPRTRNTQILMWNATGVFYAGVDKQFSYGLIPFRVFVICHVDILHIRDKYL